jgi:MYXO-CTERM domain-containing protein
MVDVNGTLVPAPGALALLGVAGLVGVRRRR